MVKVKINYGVRPLKKGEVHPTMPQAVAANQVRYFGLHKIDKRLLNTLSQPKVKRDKLIQERTTLQGKYSRMKKEYDKIKDSNEKEFFKEEKLRPLVDKLNNVIKALNAMDGKKTAPTAPPAPVAPPPAKPVELTNKALTDAMKLKFVDNEPEFAKIRKEFDELTKDFQRRKEAAAKKVAAKKVAAKPKAKKKKLNPYAVDFIKDMTETNIWHWIYESPGSPKKIIDDLYKYVLARARNHLAFNLLNDARDQLDDPDDFDGYRELDRTKYNEEDFDQMKSFDKKKINDMIEKIDQIWYSLDEYVPDGVFLEFNEDDLKEAFNRIVLGK